MALSKSSACTLLGLFFSFLAFIFGVIAENKKAPQGTPVLGAEQVICQYHKDQTVTLGFISIITLLFGVVLSHMAMFSPYKGNHAKINLLFKCTKLKVFFVVSELFCAAPKAMGISLTDFSSFMKMSKLTLLMLSSQRGLIWALFYGTRRVVSAMAFVLTLWATVSQFFILKHNVHHDMGMQCPTAKTGLIGGAGFMSLNTALMWYIVFMLSQNRKEDIFDEEYENHYDISLGSLDNPYLGH